MNTQGSDAYAAIGIPRKAQFLLFRHMDDFATETTRHSLNAAFIVDACVSFGVSSVGHRLDADEPITLVGRCGAKRVRSVAARIRHNLNPRFGAGPS